MTTSNAIKAAIKFSFTCGECDILYTLGIHLPPPRKDEVFRLAYLMPSTLQGLYRAPEKLGYMSIPQCAQCRI